MMGTMLNQITLLIAATCLVIAGHPVFGTILMVLWFLLTVDTSDT